MQEAQEFYAKDRSAWRNWLVDNHQKVNAVWLVYDKGATRTMTWEDIVQEALCFGWIDSKPGKVSDARSKIYVSKRKPKSVWSKINKAHVEYLQEKGLMTIAGQKAIDIAKQNGSWDSLNNSDNLIKPPELVDYFKQNKLAENKYQALSDSKKRNFLQSLYDTKKPDTRNNRILKFFSEPTEQ